jgi:hypothetical protein
MGLIKYAVEMDSGAMIYIPNFIKIGSGIQMLMGGIHRHTRQQGDLINLILFVFKIREIGKQFTCYVRFEVSRIINVLTSSQAISRVSVELKTNVSELSFVSIIRADVMNDHTSLI